ncbi:Rieske-like 2Fe-2S protein [Lentzea atacamensis]|uniref:cholesterol 7-desaturase n=1 Tax=Lentzea atacamensis TaxID=531938 RepID=A0ABX9EEX3_9PSEU|nr:Rieske 2Fe-2S domain-containing protein [Lentzea atacamensis]RAS69720.1 Rieske-like 2Fe-2S protein [Lentzea atacamensis]
MKPVPRLPYPDGWFAVGFSSEFPVGRVLRRNFMGEELVVYRTRSGRVCVTRPFCPHLGAHLGYGGRVEAENIVCPFHHFAFGPSGDCVRTGTGAPPPPKARLDTLEVREVNGMVLVWHHAQGATPQWEIPPVPTDGFPATAHRTFTLVDHPQDIVENSVDWAHFRPVHKLAIEVRKPPFFHGRTMELEYDGTGDHGGNLGFFSLLTANATVKVTGLGWITADAWVPKLGIRLLVWVLSTPIDPVRIDLRIVVTARLWAPPGRLTPPRSLMPIAVSRLATRAITPLFCFDLKNDFPIWENKIYQDRPRLTQGDGPITPFRRWASQFYSSPLDTH